MADIILINDQDQEQTLTGVDKLTTRSADGNKTFVFDPSGGAAVGYTETEYAISGATITGAAIARAKMLQFSENAPNWPRLTSWSYIVLQIKTVDGALYTPRGVCICAPGQMSSFSADGYDGKFEIRQTMQPYERYTIDIYVSGANMSIRSIKAYPVGSNTYMELCATDTYNITGKLVVVEKIETES